MEIKELEQKIKEAAQAYYENGKAIMTDYDFDKLVDELKLKDPANLLLTTPGFGYDVKKVGRKEVMHEWDMYTIDEKIKDFEEFKKRYGNSDDLIQVKLDGASATGYYKNGKLTKLVTRGDGKYGFDVINNVNLDGIDYIPGFTGCIRFEICMQKKLWLENYNINESPSPRNIVAGILSKLEPADWERKLAEPIVLDIVGYGGANPRYIDFSKLRYAKKLKIEEVTDKLPEDIYPTDGYVIKSNHEVYDYVYAYKPQSEMAETVIENIEWQQGSTGKLTPVLVIKPVKLSGANIMRVTGNSMQMMENLGTGIGAKVKIFRSGEVIPCIAEVLEKSDNFKLPKFDYRKGAHIFKKVDLDVIAKFIDMMSYLKHFGSSLTSKIKDKEKLDCSSDLIYFIDNIRYDRLEGYTEHEIKLLKNAITMIKGFSYQQFVEALNLPYIGGAAVEKIVKNEKLASHSEETWNKIKDEVESLINHLNQYDSEFKFEVKNEIKIEYKGKVAITGKHEMKRADMEKIVNEKGYENVGSVNKDTDYLIIADINSTSSKAKMARELGVKLISSVEDLI